MKMSARDGKKVHCSRIALRIARRGLLSLKRRASLSDFVQFMYATFAARKGRTCRHFGQQRTCQADSSRNLSMDKTFFNEYTILHEPSPSDAPGRQPCLQDIVGSGFLGRGRGH